jgi:NAD(P)-dependent dehydrogenase (short-subunit alcohol dehydrogenase family)
MTTSLRDKVAVVIGGGAGLGRHIARELIEAGAKVAVFGRTLTKLQKVADELGTNLLPLVVDVTKSEEVRRAFAEVDRAFGDVDILVNNAAVYSPFTVEEATDSQIHETFDANVIGPIYCVREAVPRMRRKGGGDIVNITSESVADPFPMLTVYAASKGALETLGVGLRNELRADRIRVTTVRSGYMNGDNSGAANWPADRLQRFIALAQVSGRPVTAEQGMAPRSTARAVLHALVTSGDAYVGMYEIRPTGRGSK